MRLEAGIKRLSKAVKERWLEEGTLIERVAERLQQ